MITQRDIDMWHVSAQDFAEQIKNEFVQSLMGNRASRQQGAMRPPAPQPQPMQPQPQTQQPPMTGGQYGKAR